jgi:ATP-binding cassette subfamily B protein
MLDGSIAENIALGRADLTDQRVRDAGRACLVDDFALTLAQGYDTQAGENGVQLSGGERQRVALARAVAGGAPVLLLDEPTTGLDGDARARVIDAITRAGTGRSVLIVTHDLDLALRADRIVDISVGDQPKRRRMTNPPARTTKEVNPHES